MAEAARITEIDISRPSRALAVLRWSDYALVVGCGLGALGTLPTFAAQVAGGRWAEFVGTGLMTAALLFAAYTGWRHVGVIDPRVWRSYLWVFPLLTGIVLLVGLTSAAEWSSRVNMPVDDPEAFLTVFGLAYFAGIAIPGFVCILRLRRTVIEPLGVPLAVLLDGLGRQGGLSGLSVARVPRAGFGRGLAYAIGGAVLLLGINVAPLPENRELASTLLRVTQQLTMLGCFLIVRARRYFQVSADALLAVDKRPPVLFLRSFADDERQQYANSQRALLDFSLEMRLANHFHRFGPFIAIGSPKESVPQPGAARVLLSNDQWQPRVLGWMKDATLIIMYSGTTQWVNWELRQVVESGRSTSLILMFPEIKGWRSSLRARAIATRVEQIRAVFKDTPWNEELAAFDDFAGLRAMLFRADGSMLMVKSRSRTRDAYHLAALVAHHQLLDPIGAPQGEAERVRIPPPGRRLVKLLAAGAAVLLVGAVWHFSPESDSRLTFKRGELYYRAPVTREEAQGVGEYLVRQQLFSDEKETAVRLAVEHGVYQLRVVIDPSYADNALLAIQLGTMGTELAGEVFAGRPVEVEIANDRLEPIKVLPASARLALGKGELYYTDPITTDEARAVGGQLVDRAFGTEREFSAHLGRERGAYQLQFVVDPARASGSEILEAFSEFSRGVAQSALGGQPVVVHVCDREFRSLASRRVEALETRQ